MGWLLLVFSCNPTCCWIEGSGSGGGVGIADDAIALVNSSCRFGISIGAGGNEALIAVGEVEVTLSSIRISWAASAAGRLLLMVSFSAPW
jgi:hypothetical protein